MANHIINRMTFLGKRLLSKAGEVLPSSLTFSSPLFIYFSASWCPPCRTFTPKLIDFYNQSKSSKKDLEIVLASLDETNQAFRDYYEKMPWLSIPLEEKKVIDSLVSKFSVRTIPTLILINEQGDSLSTESRYKIETNPKTAYDELLKIVKKPTKEYN